MPNPSVDMSSWEAGEVVERPASVVKELLENSIDAGASQITVSIESGGVKLIEISDNGTGIEAEYISTAFIRHATSKIQTPDDLVSIHTLGFRGEALASIASVARVELTTRTEQDEFATVYRIEGGEELSREPGARAVGTTIRVQDLFYNTPARMKFLKKDSSEGTFVADTVTHVALSHPEVSIKFIREGKLQYVTPGDGQLRGAAYSVLGREFSRDLVEVDNQEGVYHIRGLITPPKSCRASRSMQHFYINGRYVRNRTIMAGMEMAFKGTMMQGKFPGGILLLDMPADLVDVNVHPAKIEVRFARENDIFDVVYHAVKLALAQPGTGERHFTFEETKTNEKSKIEVSNGESPDNAVKKNNFTGLSAIIPGQADPGTLSSQPAPAPVVPVKPATKASAPAAPEKPTAAAQPRWNWKQSSVDADILDPFVTLHSPAAPQEKPAEPFRAAASEQLTEWSNRAGVELIAQQEGSDPAAVIYDAIAAAKSRHADILICDTAGRLHNKKNLMEELKKINRIIDKEYPDAYRETLVVLDGTTGQNALSQAKQFMEAADITGIILTKLDGTAKGGIAVAIQSELGIPVKYIGIGEKIEDLQKFNANDFVNALFEKPAEQ